MTKRAEYTKYLRSPGRLSEVVPCEYVCPESHDVPGLRDCCHTCTYFLGGKCGAPRGFSFYPRVMWRIYREA